MRGRLLFMLGLWLAISVSLLSALTPLGPPSSMITGSAFNPATTGVVLKARAQTISTDQRLSEPERDRNFPVTSPLKAWIVPSAALLAAVWPVRPIIPSIWGRLPLTCERISYRFQARAPPS